MDEMAISPGLKWVCCFDKLAHMQDSCLRKNQGRANSMVHYYWNQFKEHLFQILNLQFLFSYILTERLK